MGCVVIPYIKLSNFTSNYIFCLPHSMGTLLTGVYPASIDKYSQVFISMMFFYHDDIFLVLIIVFNISVQKFILHI